MQKRQVYLLSPKKLSPETIAVAFAKTSRSPDTFQKIADELTEESSARFNEKWVVGYGHSSVAEHAVLHLAIENVSRLAVECIESNRLASYTEKSTRYQRWGPDEYYFQLAFPSIEERGSTASPRMGPEGFYTPQELGKNKRLREKYFGACNCLFDTYRRSLTVLRELAERAKPRREGESDVSYDNRIRSDYVDSCRFLLPAASLANLGMTANARVLESAISKMASHPLEEVRQIGAQVKEVALIELPTLVKYADAKPYLEKANKRFARTDLPGPEEIVNPSEASLHKNTRDRDWCKLLDYDPDGETKVLALVLFRYNSIPYSNALEKIKTLSPAERKSLADKLLGSLDAHDIPLRELEHIHYTFELILDQGAYAEFKRHRMMTQTAQSLTTGLGYAVPLRMVEAGFENSYCKAMDYASDVYAQIAQWNPFVASYIVPNGFNRRVLFTMNLREAFAFCQLRSAPNAHFSMRRISIRIADEIRKVHPLLAGYINLPEETWQSVEEGFFYRT